MDKSFLDWLLPYGKRDRIREVLAGGRGRVRHQISAREEAEIGS